MTMAEPRSTLDTSLPTSAATDAHRARPRHILPTRPPYTGRVPAWVWLAVIGLCIAAALPVIRTSSVTESGAELRALEAERERLNSEIRSLADHVGQLSSLARVKLQAEQRLNMVPARPTVVLEIDEPPPARTLPTRLLPTVPSTSGASAIVDSQPDESIWYRFVDLLVVE